MIGEKISRRECTDEQAGTRDHCCKVIAEEGRCGLNVRGRDVSGDEECFGSNTFFAGIGY